MSFNSVLKVLLDFFYKVAWLTFLVLWMVELIDTGRVSNYLNLTALLVIVAILGIFTFLFPREDFHENNPWKKNYTFFAIFVIIVMVFVILKTLSFGLGAIMVSLVFILYIFIYLLITSKEHKQ
ncbi:hypothetical protein KKG41_03450 [Patescibacteria group bacterium]|nr:hypothetical protein [Patescibacteria group bacterium]MBU1890129.1 hypothetical protein [Patescibacteria group bacterium]